ncbi:MAG: hypothetical protein D6781_12755 [Verrucomicrobia bacterium]|nr:MAG: hypothetical protein D6781_12755 [Verrucomicrobiota bacterium]
MIANQSMDTRTLSDSTLATHLLDELADFVRREQAHQCEAFERLWAKPEADRVLEGRCIVGLEVAGPVGDGIWRLRCAENDACFREGDLVRVHQGNPRNPLLDAVIVTAEDTTVDLKPWSKASLKALQPGLRGLVIDPSWLDLTKMYLDALEAVEKSERGRERVLPLLAGTRRPKLDSVEMDAAMAAAREDGFDEAQAEAVASACASDSCWLVHGPPGTGKTRVLARIATRLVAQGERILVTSFTHRAINNLLEAIAAMGVERRLIARIAPAQDPRLGLPQFESFHGCPLDGCDSGYVVGATPFALRTHRLRDVDFDRVIVDEASQVTLPLAAMAMLAADRYIFAGDDKQLPPVSLTLDPQEAVSMSIFGRLTGNGFDTLLPVTRRLNAELCRWPSETFYLSRLKPHPMAAARRFPGTVPGSGFADALGPEPGLVWMAVPHEGARTCAMEEVTLLADMIAELVRGGVPLREIGVVVPFRRQARLLRLNLRGKLGPHEAIGELVADTVERMQGQEREVVFLSFATSAPDFARSIQRFLFQPQRLNVAVTRARTKVVILASPALADYARRESDDPGAATFVSLLERARRIDVDLPGAATPEC